MTLSAATGFWSYVRNDDTNSQGHIRELSKQVKAAFQLLTGEELEIFFDRESLKWGSAWDERIKESIAGTTFFIPIVTPSYLTSEACRAEFLQFWRKAKNTPLRELLLPILYVETDLPEDSDDEIVQAIRATQYVDWRETRLEDERSSIYKRALHDLSARLREISESVANEPELVTSAVGQGEDEDRPGVMDAIAESEERMENLTPLMEETQGYFFEVTSKLKSGFESLPPTGKFAAKILHLREISRSISEPAERFSANAKIVKESLSDIQDSILSATDFATAQSQLDGSDEYVREALETADRFAEIGVEVERAFGNYSDIQATIRQMTRMSRELKAPAKSLEEGMKSLFDAAMLFGSIAEEIRSRVGGEGSADAE
ncbi:toll/interleukin-1 receptor domain-containing protein [Rhodococcus rhodochrous]|uniref:toll/interleukin-1 receptor domain-containing protein n=1 Tax=Rhodococcus rhodochrous TaxID=1829 RepID=UPI0009BD4377|nr:toll/interleukin-1 receptor domain-containing protein [Rhodococcus rhodochrous]